MEEFYWRNARDSLLTERAIQLFQLLAKYEGKSFSAVKDDIDKDYLIATGRSSVEDRRHGGKIQTALAVYREAGWATLEQDGQLTDSIKITDAGKQALILLGSVPDFLKAAPYFIISLLSRYQLNNPARPTVSKDQNYDSALADSDIFPYWTLFKILDSCDFRITIEELQRFVFRIHQQSEIENTIQQIKDFRDKKSSGASEEELNQIFPEPMVGAIAEPKYIMGRLGTQVGLEPAVLNKEGQSTYVVDPSYRKFISRFVEKEPTFEEYLSEEAWMSVHGKGVRFDDDLNEEEPDEIEENLLPETDPLWEKLNSLLASNASGIILSGPPGTSKTWYASRLAYKLVGGHKKRVRFIQFHPSYSYEDFVEGYVPDQAVVGGAPGFKVKPKLFLQICEQARADSENQYVLVIDEFSRGDPSRILGELLTYLESDYREKSFNLPYSGKRTSVPKNIVIIGTMNPYDKSVTDLDDALERRFSRISMDPDVSIVNKFLDDNHANGQFKGRVINFFKLVNEKSPHGFGHAFFVDVKDESDFEKLWNHRLKFVVEKMFPFETDIVKQIAQEAESIFNPNEGD